MKKVVWFFLFTICSGILWSGCGMGGKEGTVIQEQTQNTAGGKAGVYHVGTDVLPYTEESLYQQLFDIRNKVEIALDISAGELQKLQEDYENYDGRSSKSPVYRKASIRITITTEQDTCTYILDNIGVRMKGNTSRTDFYSEEKGQYNLIHFKVDFGEQTFATLEKLELRWNKNDDSTYIREYYAYEMYRDMGVLAPHINLAVMEVAGVHQGVFTIGEPVDKQFMEKYVAEADLGGDLYKCNWANGTGANLTSVCSVGVEDEETGAFYNYDLKTNKKKSAHEQMYHLLEVLNKPEVTKEEIAAVVDMENFLAFEAVTYFTGNPDDIRNDYNNYYIYFLKSSGKAVFIPYDADRVFGLTKDWNPFGDAMTGVSPFSQKAESMGIMQENPLYIYTVNEGGYYVEEFKKVLEKAADSQWLTIEQFHKVYETVFQHYSGETKTEKVYENAVAHNFLMDLERSDGLDSTEGNASFAEYLEAKVGAYRKFSKEARINSLLP